MNAFAQAAEIERQALDDLSPFLQEKAFNGQFVLTNKGPLAPLLQTQVGDVLMNYKSRDFVLGVELKAEKEERYGNFFLEMFSNAGWGKYGWLVTLRADLLFYYFVNIKTLFVISLPQLQEWAFGSSQIWNYQIKRQGKYRQLNDTWGYCVPIKTVAREVGLIAHSLRQQQFTNLPKRTIDLSIRGHTNWVKVLDNSPIVKSLLEDLRGRI